MARSILLVDDDATVQKTLAAFFASRGWTVHRASDGIAGLAVFEREQPDVVVLDVHMPGPSGIEVLRALLTRDPDATAIMLTGHGDIEMSVEAMRIGAETFLTKPTELEPLELAAQRAREKRTLRRQARA